MKERVKTNVLAIAVLAVAALAGCDDGTVTVREGGLTPKEALAKLRTWRANGGKGTFGACMNDGVSMDSKTTGMTADAARHLFVLDAPQRKYFIDGREKVSFDGAITLTTAGNVYLGARNKNGTAASDHFAIRIYSFSMVKGGTLIRDLVPAKDNGEACLYDTVSGRFFKNAGSGGTITASEEVSRVFYGVTDISASATATRIPNGLLIGIF